MKGLGGFRNKVCYHDGSFMLSWERYRAWFAADGKLRDCEAKLGGGRCRAVPEAHRKVRDLLAFKGRFEVSLGRHAADVAEQRALHCLRWQRAPR